MQTENIGRQSYIRLLKYVKPYKTVLIIGIVAGILTGGFFGASFFWLKGFVQPFEKSTPAISQSIGSNKTTATSSVDKTKAKDKDNAQLDSILTVADKMGIYSGSTRQYDFAWTDFICRILCHGLVFEKCCHLCE